MDTSLYVNFFIALLSITNPLGKVPLWLRAAQKTSGEVRWWLALLVAGTGGAVLILFLWAGKPLLVALGVDLASFRVGGGIVVLLVGIRMLNGELMEFNLDALDGRRGPLHDAKVRFGNVVVPMVVPMIAGPASISTAIVYGARTREVMDLTIMSAVIGAVTVLVLATLLVARRLEMLLGRLVLDVQTRLFGLLLAAIAMQMVLTGLGEAFPDLLQAEHAFQSETPLQDDIDRDQPAN